MSIVESSRGEARSTPELEALNILVEAHLRSAGPKLSAKYLRALGALLTASEPSNVVGLREARRESASTREAHDWLRTRLPCWLAKRW